MSPEETAQVVDMLRVLRGLHEEPDGPQRLLKAAALLERERPTGQESLIQIMRHLGNQPTVAWDSIIAEAQRRAGDQRGA